ncbi:IS5/IS1182 family transposase, partial [Halobacteria archaeon HArc-gm2]|nr:IS5/IS1182 family transposase [Halobacteria archaeon HArc-gm2]
MCSEIRLFTRESVARAKEVVANPAEAADPAGGGSYADWAMLTVNALRIELGKSYRGTCDLLAEMPGILAEIGLSQVPHFTSVHAWFVKIPIERWRAFLDVSARHRSGHAAIDATGFDRDQPSRHYAQRAHYHLRALKVTALVDVETLYITDIQAAAGKPSDFRTGPQVVRR